MNTTPKKLLKRSYWIDTLSVEDARAIAKMFGMDNCQFEVCISNISFNHGVLGKKIMVAGKKESKVTLIGEEGAFLFFRLKFPNAFMLSETIEDNT